MIDNIAIIDYGVGNIKSLLNALKFNNLDVKADLVSDPDLLHKYSKIILPGVGAFQDAMRKVVETGFKDSITDEVKKGKYLLGICLGMQLLGTHSFEFGKFEGLNIIEGEIHPFDPDKFTIKIPHVGWNSVHFAQDDQLFNGIKDDSDFYFVHSYYFACDNPANVLAATNYGTDFTSIIRKGNVYGVQFHPEKSQKAGLRLIKNFMLI